MTSNTSGDKIHEVIIIGSGPAAHTAAIYAGRARLEPILFEGLMAGGVPAGGQLTTTTDVENFPGFPEGLSGPELCDRFRAQSIRCGCTIIGETVESIDMSKRPFIVNLVKGPMKSKSIILATGAIAKRMDIPGAGEDGYWQKGVSACAVCDGAAPIFRGKDLLVIGGGDSAMEEAIFLTKYASTVFVVHRRDELRASKVMQERALKNDKVKFLYSHVIEKVEGDGSLMKSAIIKDLKSGESREITAGGLFFAIGHSPNTKFLNNQLEFDDDGYIITKPGTSLTSVEGVFAAGDVQDKRYRQAITAAGTGCMAALDCERFLNENE